MSKRKNKSTIRAFKHLLKVDRDWDYDFLLELERKKLQRMANYFSKSDIAEFDERTAWELFLCVRLLDIIMDKERFRDIWMENAHKCQDAKFKKDKNGRIHLMDIEYQSMIPDFPKYVNLRNALRFMTPKSFPKESYGSDEEKKYWVEHFKEDTRKAKAWHLYNLIREYKMFGWWN